MRKLGVWDEWVPPKIAKQIGADFDVEVFGDFEVCPITKRTEEAMQMVCIEDASHLVIKDWDKEERRKKQLENK